MSPVLSPNISRCHDCPKPDGYKVEKPAGLAPCLYPEKEFYPLKTCARCCFNFPRRSWFPGQGSILACTHSSQHAPCPAQHRHLNQCNSWAKKTPRPINKKQIPNNKKKIQSTNKSALLPTLLSLLGKPNTLLLCLFPPGFWQSTCLCFHTYCLPFRSTPLSVMLFSEFCPLSQCMCSAEARSLEKAMNSFPN